MGCSSNCLCFLLVYVEAGGERTPKGRPPNGKSQPLGFFRRTPRRKADAPPRKRTPLASTMQKSTGIACTFLHKRRSEGRRTGRGGREKKKPTAWLFQRTPRRLRRQAPGGPCPDRAKREETPLASTKAESDELLLLAFGLCSKGEALRTQKFCHLLMGVASLISTLLTDASEFD